MNILLNIKKYFAFALVCIVTLGGIHIPAPLATAEAATEAPTPYYRGVNLAGPGFGNASYWNSQEIVDYYASKGFDIFRSSIKWERLQPELGGPLDAAYLANMKAEIQRMENAGTKVIIDLHNYGRYKDKIIGDAGSGVTIAHFEDIWKRISDEFKDNPTVYAYDLMNEPHDMGTADWKDISQAAVTAIRNNGDNTLIMVEGTAWSSSYQWAANNGTETSWIQDPADNFMYSAHIYFDHDRTGTYQRTYDQEIAINPDLEMVGVHRTMDFLIWCQKNNVRGYFGEFGTPKDDLRWNKVLDNFMKVLDDYGMDATYWSGGAFGDSYNLNLNPVNGVDAIQMRVLTDHLSGSLDSLPPLPQGIYEAEDLEIEQITPGRTDMITSLKTASGGKYRLFNGTEAGDFIEYKVNVPAPGTYQVKIKVNKQLHNGQYQLSIDGVDQGNGFDAYYFTVDDDKIFDLGYMQFDSAGDKKIRFTSTGKNVTATGYKLPLDYIQLAPFTGTVPDPVPPPQPDLEAPGAPTEVILTAKSLSEVEVKWNASTDNIGVIGYIIYRDGGEAGRSDTTTFTDKAAQPGIEHEYTVKAYDRFNLSDPSQPVRIKTENTAPVFLPIESFETIQYTISQANVGGNIVSSAKLDEQTGKIALSMDLSGAWIAHEQHPLFYYVPLYDGGEVIARLTDADQAAFAGIMVAEKITDDAPRLMMAGLTTDAYSADWGPFKVHSLARTQEFAAMSKNRYESGNDQIFKQILPPFWARLVREGDRVSAYIKNSDGSWGNGKGGVAPLQSISFDGLSAYAPVYAGVGMTGDKTKGNKWSAEFDSFSLPDYPVQGVAGEPVTFPVRIADPDGQQVTVSIQSSELPQGAGETFVNDQFTWADPVPGTYKITFSASDGLSEAEPMSVVLKIRETDQTPPTVPEGLTAKAASHDQIKLSWSPSSDDIEVEGYIIYRNGAEIGRTAQTAYTDHGLEFFTEYNYYVRAYDRAGNESGNSETVLAVTDNLPLSLLPPVDFKSVQYTVSASTAEGTISSSASLDEATGKINLDLDFARASKAHEQHPIFYYVPLYGDGEVTARLLEAENANYAGLMITDRITDDAPRLLMTGLTTDAYSPSFGPLKLHSFARTDGTAVAKNRHDAAQDDAYKNLATPFEVKMVRDRNRISSYIRNGDGGWGNGKGGTGALRTVTFSDLDEGAPVYAGVAVSGDLIRGTSWSAAFDQLYIPEYTLPVTADGPVSFPVNVVSPIREQVSIEVSSDLPNHADYTLANGRFVWNNPQAGTYHVTLSAGDGYTLAKPMTIKLEVAPGSGPDTTALQLLIAAALNYSNEDGRYTPASFADLLEAITVAQEALSSGTISSEEQLVAEIAALQQAIDKLEPSSEGPEERAGILPIADQTLTQLTEGYSEDEREELAVAVIRSAAGTEVTGLTAALSGNQPEAFELVQLPSSVLNDSLPETTMTIRAISGLPAGEYSADVLLSAEQMEDVTFKVIQTVNSIQEPTDPEAPEGTVTLGAVPGDGQVRLQWNTVTGATYYNVYQAAVSGSYDLEPLAKLTGTTYTLSGLSNGAPYFFRVQAGNDYGLGEPSNEVRVVPSAPPSGGQSPGTVNPPTPAPSGGQSSPPAVETVLTSKGFRINDKEEPIGIISSRVEQGRTVTVLSVDSEKTKQLLESAGSSAILTLTADSSSDRVIGEFDAGLMEQLIHQQVWLEIKTEQGVFSIPAQRIPLDALASRLLTGNEAEGLKIEIEVAVPAKDKESLMRTQAEQEQITLIAQPLEFAVRAVQADKTVQADAFDKYAVRLLALERESNVNGKVVGITIGSDGALRPVPAKIVVIDGQIYAQISGLTNGMYAAGHHSAVFDDTGGHWVRETAADMGSRLIVRGDEAGNFNPDNEMTRAEFAAILARGLALTAGTGTASFKDVKETNGYHADVRSVALFGLVDGFEDGSFRPAEKLTREQAAVILARAMELTELKAQLPVQGAAEALRGFEDRAQVSEWARDSIADCLQAGIFLGTSGTQLSPKSSLTRAEAVTVIQRLLQMSGMI